MRKSMKTAAFFLAAFMAAGSTFPAFAVTAQDVINGNPSGYTAGTSSVYGPSLTQEQLNAVAQAVADFTTNNITNSMDNDTKIRTAYDYLVNHVSYIDWDQREGANAAYGALVRGQAACSGYARAFKALCDAMGVSCYYIHSTGNDHQWNLVEFNDGYYFVDVQANDSSGFDWIYHFSEHPYPYDTAQFPAVGSKSGQNTAGTSETEEESNTEIPWIVPTNSDGLERTEGWQDFRWRWKDENGNYYKNCWVNFAGSNCWMYLDAEGYSISDADTPDGYHVNESGYYYAPQYNENGKRTLMAGDIVSNNVDILEERVDTNGNTYYLIGSDTTSIAFDYMDEIDESALILDFAVYRYNPGTNTIYPFSNDGTAVYEDFQFGRTYDFKITNTDLTGPALVEYCKQNDLVICVDVSNRIDGIGVSFLYCYE